MATTEYFHSKKCPRCGHDTLLRVGDSHYTVTPLAREDAGRIERAPDVTCYVKTCGNCAYVEFFSKTLADRFEKRPASTPAFGEITRTPDGQYLVSIFKQYEYRGTRAEDFTVPLDAAAWFELTTALDGLSDTQVVDAVLSAPYKQAWIDRVGPIPPGLGAQLRALVGEYLRNARGDEPSPDVSSALLLIKAEADRMRELADRLNVGLHQGFADQYLHLRFRPSFIESAIARAIPQLRKDEALMKDLDFLRGTAAAADEEAERLARGGGDGRRMARFARDIMNCAVRVPRAIDRLLGV